MIYVACDLCGDKVALAKRVKITVQSPTGKAGRTVEDVLEEKDSRFSKSTFDACQECGLTLELSLKKSKLAISNGERPACD